MLLTMPERRRFVADLRMQGYDRRQVLLLLYFQALALGIIASLVGVVLGDALSSEFFHRVPTYLAAAFPIGTKQIVHPRTVLAAFGCGVLATVLASLTPAFDLREGRAVDAVFREHGGRGEIIGERATRTLGLAGLASLALITVLVLAMPGLTIVGGVALALTTLLLIPAMFSGIARALPWMGDHVRSSALVVAVSELRATSMRAVALAGIVGLAVYGSIAIGGARGDLIRGIDRATAQYFGTADIWVGTGHDIFNVNRFAPGNTVSRDRASARRGIGARLSGGSARRRAPAGCGYARDRRGIRRWWNPANCCTEIWRERRNCCAQAGGPRSRARSPSERGLHLGDTFSLPAPSGTATFRTAAIMTNSGWPPGTITIDTRDYSRYWQTTDPVGARGEPATGRQCRQPADEPCRPPSALVRGCPYGRAPNVTGNRRPAHDRDWRHSPRSPLCS